MRCESAIGQEIIVIGYVVFPATRRKK